LTHDGAAESGAPWFDVEYTRLFRITAKDIYVDVRIPRNVANPSGCHLNLPFTYPATSSVPWTGMAVGLLLSRMILVIITPLVPSLALH